MQIKIKCEQCGVEKEIEIKVPRFCGNICRLANLRARRKNVKPTEVPTGDTVVSTPETTGDTPVQQ